MRDRTVDVSSSSTALQKSFRERDTMRDEGRGKFKRRLNEMFSGPSLYLYYFNYTKKEQNVLISGNKRLEVLSVEDEGMTESKTLL